MESKGAKNEAGPSGKRPRQPDGVDRETKRPRKMIHKYAVGGELGRGSYGQVKLVVNTDTSMICAAKAVYWPKPFHPDKPYSPSELNTEVKIYRILSHKNVVRMMEYFVDGDKLYMILEYCVASLYKMQRSSTEKKFPEVQAQYYFAQLLDGLEYIHSQRIIHNDIKPENILITRDQVVKITDFGISEMLELHDQTDLCEGYHGTLLFQSPEVVNRTNTKISGTKKDVWSSGVTLYYMTTGRYPFDGDNRNEIIRSIVNGQYYIHEDMSAQLGLLFRGMLEREPNKRLSIQEIKLQEWVVKQPRGPDESWVVITIDETETSSRTWSSNNFFESIGQIITISSDGDSEVEIVDA